MSPPPSPSAPFTGQVALVTGGATGIGLASALALARRGAAAVVIAGRRQDAGQVAAEAITQTGVQALFVKADLTREADVVQLVDTVLERFGQLNLAFNNAGFQERRAPLGEQTLDTYRTVFDANVASMFLCMREEIRAMEQAGGGVIVNNASVSGVRNSNPGLSLYSASKAAVISLTRSAAMEYAARGIRINAVAPGRVVTDMVRGSGIDLGVLAAGLPVRRMGEPEEVAEAVAWLASPASGFVVGHVLCADGGFLAQ